MAEKTFTLEIVTPDKVLISDDQVVSLVAPGAEGYLGIMANHAPMITELIIGEMRVRRADGSETRIATTQGFMEVSENRVTALSDAAEKAEDIDIDRAREAEHRAKEWLAHAEEGVDFTRAEVALKRAINRIRVGEGR